MTTGRGHGAHGAKTPLDDEVRAAGPSWLPGAALALVEATAVALLIIQAGWALDDVASGRLIGGPRIAGLVAASIIATLCAGAAPWLAQSSAARTEKGLRRLVVAGAFRLGVTGTRGRAGELLSLAGHAVEKAAHYRAAFIGPMVGALASPLLVLLIMGITIDWPTAGWLALLLLIVPLAVGGFRRVVRPIGASYRRTQGQLTAGFLESIQALGTLVYARAADRAAADLARRGERHRRSVMRLLAGNQLLILVVDAAFSLAVTAASAGLALIRLRGGAITLGEAVAVVLLAVLVTGPADVFGSFFYIGIGGRAAQSQLSAHAARARAASHVIGEREVGGSAAVELDGVTLGWPGAAPVLTDFSLRIEEGERVAIVGPSGVGKSTLSALLQAHLTPAAGAASVAGLDIAASDPDLVRARLAVLEQRAHLFLGSIAENLRLADPEADDARLWEALALAGMDDEVRRMPGGLDAQVGEHGSRLSGGQAQRLAIARAALRDAPVLILDEPTSQVDLGAEAEILAALDRLAAGRTVVMIAHRPGAILAADRVRELGGVQA